MLVLQGLVVALSALFYLRARVAIADAFAAFGTAIPGPAALGIAPWFLPSAVGLALVMTAFAMLASMKRSKQLFLLGAALCVSSFALIFAVAAAFLAVFQPVG